MTLIQFMHEHAGGLGRLFFLCFLVLCMAIANMTYSITLIERDGLKENEDEGV